MVVFNQCLGLSSPQLLQALERYPKAKKKETVKRFISIIIIVFANLIQAQSVNIKDLVLVSNKLCILEKNKIKEIEIRLLNNSNDTLKYRTLSCSWQEFYLSNSENINININNCDKNIPAIITLNPNESRTVKLTIIARKQIPNYFKIGLKICQIKKSESLKSHNELENCEIIWCSTISTRK